MKTMKLLGILMFGLLLSSRQASAIAINFDEQGYTGSSLFGATSQTLAIGEATFRGGVILSNATNLLANTTSVYGTAGFIPGMSHTLEIDFTAPIHNIYFNLYNGWTTNMSYRVYDDAGNSAIFNLTSNTYNGQSLVEFAATGSRIFIECASIIGYPWDFVIDNIHYNEALPSAPVPEPASLLLLGAGLAGIGFMKKKIWS